MRETLFKAKRIDNREWVEGCHIFDERNEKKHYIGYVFGSDNGQPHDIDVVEVDPCTLCQYTGLTDKNGKKIWENDVVNCIAAECCGYISWNESEAGFYFCVLLEDGCYEEEHIYDYVDELEVIGNIFDNPKLLKEGAE